MGKNITMRDIAEQLGVSTVTVSKALTGKEGVSDSVRDMIRQKAEEMNYRYNFMGKSMKEGMNYNIGVIVAEQFMQDSAFYAKMYQTLSKDLMQSNYFGILEVITTQAELECQMPHILLNNKVDGVILLGQMSRPYIELIESADIPYIFLDFSDEHFEVDTIISDNLYGAYELTNHLISLGHKEIGFVGNKNATTSIMDRYIGYYKALLENRLELVDEWVINDRDDLGKYCELVLPKVMPTAFVCNNDEIAYHFILLLKKNGYRVPEDISVVGYDNYIYATLSVPKITTMEVNVEAMAEAAVHSIITRLKNPDKETGRKVISGRMIVRESADALII
jgi:LacI family transcriptional regulator